MAKTPPRRFEVEATRGDDWTDDGTPDSPTYTAKGAKSDVGANHGSMTSAAVESATSVNVDERGLDDVRLKVR